MRYVEDSLVMSFSKLYVLLWYPQNAIKIQAVVRSYLCRKKAKDLQRTHFDEHWQLHPLTSLDDLQYLLVRLLFFYGRGDEHRFITVGQFILKNSRAIFDQLAVHSAWQHRINRLLLISINQLFASDGSHAIPLRLLELFTKGQTLQDHVTDRIRLPVILETTFSFLVRHGFFSTMRKLLEEKTPPLDGPTAVAPTAFCDALLQLLVRPLVVIADLPEASVTVSSTILCSFLDVLLIPEMTEPVYNLLLPYLATWGGLPFAALVECCQSRVQTTTSVYLLYSVLKLSEGHVQKLTNDLVSPYLSVVAKLSPCIWRLPRRSTSLTFAHTEDDDDTEAADEDSDEEEEEMETDVSNGLSGTGSRLERNTLREIVVLLNENRLTDQIMACVDTNVENLTFLNHLCNICHVLMVHSRSAMYEYRLVYLLSSKTRFIRSVWHVMTTMRPHGKNFTSPLNLISKGIFVRKLLTTAIIFIVH